MTDNLRDRIAAVLYRLWRQRFPRSSLWEQLAADEREPWLTDADAVIRELGLRQEWLERPHSEERDYRFVTDWKADDE